MNSKPTVITRIIYIYIYIYFKEAEHSMKKETHTTCEMKQSNSTIRMVEGGDGNTDAGGPCKSQRRE